MWYSMSVCWDMQSFHATSIRTFNNICYILVSSIALGLGRRWCAPLSRWIPRLLRRCLRKHRPSNSGESSLSYTGCKLRYRFADSTPPPSLIMQSALPFPNLSHTKGTQVCAIYPQGTYIIAWWRKPFETASVEFAIASSQTLCSQY